MTDMAMTNELKIVRLGSRLGLAIGLALAATAAQAQSAPAAGVSYGAPPLSYGDAGPAPDAESDQAPDAAPQSPRRRSHAEIHPYLEVAQVVSAELEGGGDTLTYTSVAAGVDGVIETRRVIVAASYRYQRNFDYDGAVGDEDIHSGVAAVQLQIVPGVVSFDAGALATRTAGEGRAAGVTSRDGAVEVYSAYAGPTVTANAGPVTATAAYRLGYVAIDDDSLAGGPREDFDDAVAHSAMASVTMAPGRLPFGVTVSGGWTRTDSDGPFEHEFEGRHVRGEVLVPLGPNFALTGGVGYEDIESSQLDFARDANGVPLLDAAGRPIPDSNRPRLRTLDLSGTYYDGGFIWRPSSRTEVQAHAGRRYGGTTVVGSLSHQTSEHAGVTATVFDTVETFSNSLVSNLSSMPRSFNVNRNVLTGGFGNCVFGSEPGRGACLDSSLQSVRGESFRARGGNLLFSAERGPWSFGIGGSYVHRRYARVPDPVFDALGGSEDDSVSLYGQVSRRLSRTSEINFDAYATWYDTNLAGFNEVFSAGGTLTYQRNLLLDRLEFLAAIGLYHSNDGALDSTVAQGLIGLRYTF